MLLETVNESDARGELAGYERVYRCVISFYLMLSLLLTVFAQHSFIHPTMV